MFMASAEDLLIIFDLVCAQISARNHTLTHKLHAYSSRITRKRASRPHLPMSNIDSLMRRYIQAYSNNPKKALKNINKLLQKFKGREQKLLWLMTKKYGHTNLQFMAGLNDEKLSASTWRIRLLQFYKWLNRTKADKKQTRVCLVLYLHMHHKHTQMHTQSHLRPRHAYT